MTKKYKTMIQKKSMHQDLKSYLPPVIEVMEVKVESGFAVSDSQQEPSPWEDM